MNQKVHAIAFLTTEKRIEQTPVLLELVRIVFLVRPDPERPQKRTSFLGIRSYSNEPLATPPFR